jgi:uncharacterized membrane protein (DUF106 family)
MPSNMLFITVYSQILFLNTFSILKALELNLYLISVFYFFDFNGFLNLPIFGADRISLTEVTIYWYFLPILIMGIGF